MQETWVKSLGWEDPLEKEMTTYSSILAWEIPWIVEPGGLYSPCCLSILYIVEGDGTPLQYSCLENPRTEEPGGLQSMGSLRVGHD